MQTGSTQSITDAGHVQIPGLPLLGEEERRILAIPKELPVELPKVVPDPAVQLADHAAPPCSPALPAVHHRQMHTKLIFIKVVREPQYGDTFYGRNEPPQLPHPHLHPDMHHG